MATKKNLGPVIQVKCLGDTGKSVVINGISMQYCIEKAEELLECNIADIHVLKFGERYLLLSDDPDEAAYVEVDWKYKKKGVK